MWRYCVALFALLWPANVIGLNVEFLRDILQQLQALNNFTTTAIFLDEVHDTEQLQPIFDSINGEQLQTTQLIFTNNGQQRWTSGMEIQPLRLSVNDNLLVICLCHDISDNIWQRVDVSLRNFRHVKLLVLINNEINLGNKMLSICQQLWQMQFLDVLVMQHQQLYTYTAYPTLKVDVIANASRQQLIRRPVQTNLHGYVVGVPIESDTPRIFHVRNPKSGRAAIKGFAFEIFHHFLQQMDAKLKVTSLSVSDVNMDHLVQMIRQKQLEISVHPFSGTHADAAQLSYPLFKLRRCLIVPVQHEIPHYMYLLRPFKFYSWLLIVCAIFATQFVLAWFKPYITRRRGDRYGLAFLESVGYLLFLPSSLKLQRPSKRFICIFLQLSVLGFFLTAAYCNLLATFLTISIEGKQINTFTALIAGKLPVLVKTVEVEAVKLQIPEEYRCAMQKLIRPVESHVHMRHLLNFNTSYAYLVTEDRWLFLNMQQQFSYTPIFRFSDICFAKSFVSYIMRTDSHLERPLNKFILDVQAAGLDKYWLTSDFNYALQAGYVHLIYEKPAFKALDFNNFQLAWFILGAGWSFATIAFVFEYMRGLKGRRNKRQTCQGK